MECVLSQVLCVTSGTISPQSAETSQSSCGRERAPSSSLQLPVKRKSGMESLVLVRFEACVRYRNQIDHDL